MAFVCQINKSITYLLTYLLAYLCSRIHVSVWHHIYPYDVGQVLPTRVPYIMLAIAWPNSKYFFWKGDRKPGVRQTQQYCWTAQRIMKNTNLRPRGTRRSSSYFGTGYTPVNLWIHLLYIQRSHSSSLSGHLSHTFYVSSAFRFGYPDNYGKTEVLY